MKLSKTLKSKSPGLSGLLRSSLLSATVAGMALMAGPTFAQTLTAVKHSALRVLDPIMTTAYMSRNHGYMIFDTLYALDSDLVPQPQMVESHTVSDDGLTYKFTLRTGLKFHDGAPVTGEDVAASIARWGERDGMGQVLMSFVDSMSGDGNVFVMQLKKPYGLVIDSLAKPSSNVPFIMPKRLAETPSTEPIPDQIGSGPFVWVADEFQPGVKAVYAKNEDYVPRDEPASWASGGKVVKVDRVEWVVISDDQTTLNALQAGEIDYWESPPNDLLPIQLVFVGVDSHHDRNLPSSRNEIDITLDLLVCHAVNIDSLQITTKCQDVNLVE